jgi:glycosyltransferase involved in cell wall biosynthesis
MQYFFDVTDIKLYVKSQTSISGIQRVAFEVIKRMVKYHGTQAIKLCYWDKSKQVYVSIPSDFISDMKEFDIDIFSKVFFGGQARLRSQTPPTLERYRNKPIKYWLHYLHRSLHAARGNEAPFTKRNSSISEWRAWRADEVTTTKDKAIADLPRVPVAKIAQAGDQLIMIGATWGIDGLSEEIKSLSDHQGLQISQFVYDLIPIVMPEHIETNFGRVFYQWLFAATNYCHRFFVISQNTGTDLAAFMAQIGITRPIHVVPLAQDFVLEAKDWRVIKGSKATFKDRVELANIVRKDILNLSKYPFVLVVGTLETRKNLWRLAQAWLRLSREEGLEVPKLVFAGRMGWHCEDFKLLMNATGNLGGWVEFADRPSDVELAWMYETCVFTAMVSSYEGWGLPIGESLFFGKTAIVANNSSMPEVGGEMVEYCDADSIDSIHAAARKLIINPQHRAALEAKIAATQLRTWDDVANDLAAMISRLK